MISGIEGGIQYWARVEYYWRPARGVAVDDPATDLQLACDLIDRDTGDRIVLCEQWANGLRLMAERYPRKFVEVVDGTGDATTGNVFYARVCSSNSPRSVSCGTADGACAVTVGMAEIARSPSDEILR